jgi:DnaJ family protein C protein 7
VPPQDKHFNTFFKMSSASSPDAPSSTSPTTTSPTSDDGFVHVHTSDPNTTTTPSQGIKRKTPVDQFENDNTSSGGGKKFQEDDQEEDDSDDYFSSSGDSDDGSSGDSDDDLPEMIVPETDEERLARALQAKNDGNDCFRAQDYKTAVLHYNEAVEADPTSAMYLNNRAAAHLQLGNYEQAIGDGKQCVALDDSYFKGWYRLATGHLKVGDLESCRATLTQAYLRDTQQQKKIQTMRTLVDEVAAMLEEAEALIADKKYSQAVRTIFQCQKHVPGWSGLLVLRCEALVGTRSFPEAYALATDMLRRDPNNSDAMYWRAQALYYQGDFAKAIKNMKAVLLRDPDNKKSQTLIKKMRKLEKTKLKGNTAFKGREWQEAINAYTECLEIDPTNAQFNAKLLCNRAAAYMHQGHHKRVVKDCNAAIYADSTYAKAYIRRGDAYVAMGGVDNFEIGIKDFKKAHGFLPEDSAAYRDVSKKIKSAQLSIKKANRKDYYGLLGIPENANAAMIKKGYRKSALKWHPDRHATKTDEQKAYAEKMFKDCNEANDVRVTIVVPLLCVCVCTSTCSNCCKLLLLSLFFVSCVGRC